MSTTAVSPVVAAKGGSFLIETRTPAEVFTPEDLNEEQRQIAATAAKFARDEVLPLAADIEAKKPGVLAGLLRKAAELGFASVDIPEEYGGLGHGQDHLDDHHGPPLDPGKFLDRVRRTHRHRDAAAGLVWHRGAEANATSPSWRRQSGWRPTACRRRHPAPMQ